MTTASVSRTVWTRWRCPYRAAILIGLGAALVSVFWFASRYPALIAKASHPGAPVSSMAFAAEVLHVDPAMPWWERIARSAVNWLDAMKIGMSFGVAFGALLHTALRYYPLKLGSNLYLNSIKGALIGVPAGVCANCAVPAACGLTRGHGRVEVALGFLLSSPNFNPVVVTMTFAVLPPSMAIAKYALLVLTIVLVVPGLIGRLERSAPLPIRSAFDAGLARTMAAPCDERFADVARALARELGAAAWMLIKPTLLLMLGASVAAAVLLELVPWQTVLANTSAPVMLAVAVVATAMPVPIALDVMFAAVLLRTGVAPGYVMLFAMTLGIYSIVPAVYLWRDVSRRLAVALAAYVVLVGWICGIVW